MPCVRVGVTSARPSESGRRRRRPRVTLKPRSQRSFEPLAMGGSRAACSLSSQPVACASTALPTSEFKGRSWIFERRQAAPLPSTFDDHDIRALHWVMFGDLLPRRLVSRG
jgi:hypothetical protein